MSWALVAVLLVLSGGAHAQVGGGVVREVGVQHFQVVDFRQAELVGGCGEDNSNAGGGDFELLGDGRGFRFYERPPSDGLPALGDAYRDGYGSTGCGTATFPIHIPNGTEAVQLRFEGDRRIDTLDQDAGADLLQEVSLRYPDARDATHEVFSPDEGSQAMATIAIPPFIAQRPGPAEVEWYFEDRGLSALGQGSPNPLSGQDFQATVMDAVVSFSATHNDLHSTTTSDSRDGTQLTTQHRVDVRLPASPSGPFVALHVRVAPGLEIDRVLAPDGTDLGEVQTFDGEGVRGQDQTHLVLELQEDGVMVLVPAPLTALHGQGTYRFVFVERSGVEVSPALQPMSIVLLLAPLPFAVLAWREARAFRQEAFGGYARSARNLQRGVVLVSLYYLAVVASAALGERLALMAVWPMPLEGLLLYVQVLLAIVAFTALWRVARELYRITYPREDVRSGETIPD